MDTSPAEILRLHRWLDGTSRTGAADRFLSGWQTTHPYVGRYLGADREVPRSPRALESYSFLSDSGALTDAITRFHAKADGVVYEPNGVYVSCGSSPLLLGFFLALRELEVEEICYAPPVYYSCYYFARSLGIPMHRAGTDLLHDETAELHLPEAKSALILCDPIWVFGTTVHERQLERIARWQRRTGSFVLVDGTFQYARWDRSSREEPTSRLEQDLTFRIVCPTKSLAVHGTRFAYLLLPPAFREPVRYACANITGATGTANEHFALRIMDVLDSDESNDLLVRHIRTQRTELISRGIIRSEAAPPEAGYYTFARLDEASMRDAIVMDQRFFGLQGFQDHVRVNLLHPGWSQGADARA
ncbi:pyridoxal phosphate-dependent aminotransferase [Streptomyces johnsoniae]|uniref:Pyridoxal phosphate-dependent aminotransferase n=1 Tax=Streptomyces johnsoniae TaxID=3075532 RepID=A0ABU2RZC0_9ACTN|nr:pyridoxal phosphate-dependent aminotransferase [Streptomyces sp. DSM 41886]MDT0442060.1 pyridoxal phosphate-dependent aminotransferase [Streptomyces sp. DSM 41886]